ncbi:MAG: hypothetical protein AAF417_18670 [Pseudomonadota bacterium]
MSPRPPAASIGFSMFPLTRRLSRALASLLTPIGLTPGVSGTLATLLALEAAWSFSHGSARGDFVGAITWLLATVLFDNVRCQLALKVPHARATPAAVSASAGLMHVLVFLGLGIGAVTAGAGLIPWYAALLAGFGCAVVTVLELNLNLTRLLMVPAAAPPASAPGKTTVWEKWLDAARDDFGFLVLLGAGLNLLWLLLPFAALALQVYWIREALRFYQSRQR